MKNSGGSKVNNKGTTPKSKGYKPPPRPSKSGIGSKQAPPPKASYSITNKGQPTHMSTQHPYPSVYNQQQQQQQQQQQYTFTPQATPSFANKGQPTFMPTQFSQQPLYAQQPGLQGQYFYYNNQYQQQYPQYFNQQPYPQFNQTSFNTFTLNQQQQQQQTGSYASFQQFNQPIPQDLQSTNPPVQVNNHEIENTNNNDQYHQQQHQTNSYAQQNPQSVSTNQEIKKNEQPGEEKPFSDEHHQPPPLQPLKQPPPQTLQANSYAQFDNSNQTINQDTVNTNNNDNKAINEKKDNEIQTFDNNNNNDQQQHQANSYAQQNPQSVSTNQEIKKNEQPGVEKPFNDEHHQPPSQPFKQPPPQPPQPQANSYAQFDNSNQIINQDTVNTNNDNKAINEKKDNETPTFDNNNNDQQQHQTNSYAPQQFTQSPSQDAQLTNSEQANNQDTTSTYNNDQKGTEKPHNSGIEGNQNATEEIAIDAEGNNIDAEKPLDANENQVDMEKSLDELDTKKDQIDTEKPLDAKENQVDMEKSLDTKEDQNDKELITTEKDIDNAKEQPKREKDKVKDKKTKINYTLKNIAGHETEVLTLFAETKDAKYAQLMKEHYSKKNIQQNKLNEMKKIFDNIFKSKDDEDVTNLLLSLLSLNIQFSTADRIRAILDPQYILTLKEKEVNIVVDLIGKILSNEKEAQNKSNAITSTLLEHLTAEHPQELPGPLWKLLKDVTVKYGNRFMAYRHVLRYMSLVDISGDALDHAVYVLHELIDQQRELNSHSSLIKVFDKYKSNENFFNFFIFSCSKIFAKTGRLIPKDGAHSSDFANVFSNIILDEQSPYRRKNDVIIALANIFKRKDRPNSEDVKERSLNAVHAFITDNKDKDALISGLTVLRGVSSKTMTEKLIATGNLITGMVLNYPQALEDKVISINLFFIIQKEALRRELTEEELNIINLIAERDNYDTRLFSVITGIAANALYTNDIPRTPCEKLKPLVNKLTNKISTATVPIKFMELLSNFLLLIKNIISGAVTLKEGYADIFSEKEVKFVEFLCAYAPFLYDAFTKKPSSTLVKYLIKTFLESVLLITYKKELLHELYNAVYNFFIKFEEVNDPTGITELKNIILNIYLINTSKSSTGKAFLIESKCKVLPFLLKELTQYPSNFNKLINTRVTTILGIFCNILTLDTKSSGLDVNKILEATFALLKAKNFPREVIVAATRLIWRIASRNGGKNLVTKDKKGFLDCIIRIMDEIGPMKKKSEEDIVLILNTFIFVTDKDLVKEFEEKYVSRICQFVEKTKSYPNAFEVSIKFIRFVRRQNRKVNNYFDKYLTDPKLKALTDKYFFTL